MVLDFFAAAPEGGTEAATRAARPATADRTAWAGRIGRNPVASATLQTVGRVERAIDRLVDVEARVLGDRLQEEALGEIARQLAPHLRREAWQHMPRWKAAHPSRDRRGAS